ncbi:hypothetical protein PHYBOEH_011258 [Phytophthora boehmeriae]|uniref:RxLR effector protein n=1 Tax=Phytophthora boehmeriae TaxID=109152 RepID=A0A8T1X3W4_9STRA|nr:hypothetical protein PHYBOEH_011258 [Phytophthora boehmeriae]
MKLSYFLVVATTASVLASGKALSDFEQSTIAKMPPTQDLVHSVNGQEPHSGGKRLLRGGIDAEERAWTFLRYSNLVKDKQARELQFEKWFEKGVQAVKAEKKMLRFAFTKEQKAAFKKVAEDYAAYRRSLGY